MDATWFAIRDTRLHKMARTARALDGTPEREPMLKNSASSRRDTIAGGNKAMVFKHLKCFQGNHPAHHHWLS